MMAVNHFCSCPLQSELGLKKIPILNLKTCLWIQPDRVYGPMELSLCKIINTHQKL